MRLEIDTTVSAPPLADETGISGSVDPTEVKSALNQGVKAAQAGNRTQARTALLRATELDPQNESAWLWLASISEYPEELLGFLNHVLAINPENQRANEWKIATHALLSKTFVQRGIDASQDNQKDFAVECFQTALEHDERNAVAWMWMASLSNSATDKISLLQRAIAIDPENETAAAALDAAKSGILKQRLTDAKSAAVAGKHAEAIEILDTLLVVKPDSIDAWTLKSHLSESFDEKIRCFENILAIDPENIAAKAGRDSLLAIFGTAEAARAESVRDSNETREYDRAELTQAYEVPSPFAETYVESVAVAEHYDEPAIDKSPTQDLELPAAFSNVEAETSEPHSETTPEEYNNEQPEIVAEPFASFAEETTRLYETPASSPEQLIPEDEAEPLSLGSMSEYDLEQSRTDSAPADVFVPEYFYPDPESETVAYSYDSAGLHSEYDEPIEHSDWSDEDSEPAIAMPVEQSDWANEDSEPAIAIPVEQSDWSDEDSEPAIAMPVEQTDWANEDSEPAIAMPVEQSDWSDEDSEPAIAMPVERSDWSNEDSEPAIAMPAEDLLPEQTAHDEADETLVDSSEVLNVSAESIECPFCSSTNDAQVIACRSCMAVLTLSDLELLLANQNADIPTLRRAVDEMEGQRQRREFSTDELVTLGLGHLNLRNLQAGYSCLHDASRLSPNNVVLGGQVNALLIRLEEIKAQEEAHLKMPKGKSILVVDDSPTVRKLIAGKLEKCGHEVVCATDGVEAMERLQNFVPDLVLLDITMPRMDGYQVCKNIRSNSATKDVTVVMISGKDGFFDKVRGRMAGTTGYITKPFGPETLMKAVEMYLSGEAPELDEV